MVIIGGGVIGVEFASIYADFGCSVTIIEMLPQILPGADGEAVSALRKVLEARGITIHTGAKVGSIEAAGSSLVISADLSGREEKIGADKVLVAVGRKPFTEGLNLEAAGIRIERDRISVDKSMRTSVPHIFAVGDCCSPIMLAHVAMMEGEVAAGNIFGLDEKMDYSTTPGCVYTSPELAWAGLTEEEAKKRGHKVRKGVFPMIGNAKSLISGETRGMVKIVADEKYGEILGVHIVGARATDLISEASSPSGSKPPWTKWPKRSMVIPRSVKLREKLSLPVLKGQFTAYPGSEQCRYLEWGGANEIYREPEDRPQVQPCP